MTKLSEIDSSNSRHHPLDDARAIRLCKMTAKQAAKIRDMPRDELANQIFVNAEEFAYITGRSRKSVCHLMDRNQVPVHREGMPGSKRPRRFIMLQEYLNAMRNCRALVTADEHYYIDRLMRDRATFRRAKTRGQQPSDVRA
ncbi:hypothetical protein IFU02_019980 [Pantoea agglomerans]|uniref:hypothetical protein n=1 Tax=Enterobacter agglomerans TaxID=549 RepID=UPI001FCE89AB|nr:hypothetical protein [Pantoea agglomerans]WVL84723.1 hypothetical protein IFU02_019980 [Pantoea agglomerans]